MLKYKATQKVIATNEEIEKYNLHSVFTFEKPNLIAYKIIAGLYIFYISHSTYEQGVKENIIDPVSNLPTLTYSTMRLVRGMVINHRMTYALKSSTLLYLKSELKRVNTDPKIINLKVYDTQWWVDGVLSKEPILTYLESIKVNLETGSILSYIKSPNNIRAIFREVKTHENFLDVLADALDREFMNTRNIFDKFQEVDFYEQDYWLQRGKEFEFTFE